MTKMYLKIVVASPDTQKINSQKNWTHEIKGSGQSHGICINLKAAILMTTLGFI